MRTTRRSPFPALLATAFLALVLVPQRSVHASTEETARAARDACKAALAREAAGQPTASSREICHKAFVYGSLPEDYRNEVASLMSPARHPTLDDVVLGGMMSEAALKKATDQPWGYLARCDIARRLGDAETMAACLADLQRFAPKHPMTKWALATAAERAPVGVWIFRLALLAALIATAAHAARGVWQARRQRRLPALAVLVASGLLLGLGAGRAHAAPAEGKDHLSEFTIDDDNPEGSVPSVEAQMKSPLEFGYFLQDLTARAERASRTGDHALSARYYGALTKAAPTVGYGPREMCVELEAAGDLPKAVLACRSVLARLGTTVDDFTRFISLVLAQKDPLPTGERQELDAVIKHLTEQTQLGAVPTILHCEVALRYRDFPALETCTAQLTKLAPNDPKTVSFQWALALHKHDSAAAFGLIDRARTLGMSPDGVARMEHDTRAVIRRRWGRVVLVVLAAGFIAAAIWLGRRQLISRRQHAAASV